MRVMFYGLQNSGATLVALFAGQRRDTVVIPDLWTMHRAPEVADGVDACVKVTITAAFPLEEHLESYRPDHVFLVVRRPADNVASLRRKPFARHDGTMEEKFALADAHFSDPARFSGVIHFEDFVADPTSVAKLLSAVGWDLPDRAADFPRTALDMERFIWRTQPDLYHRAQWGTGQARVEPLSRITVGAVDDESAAAFARAHSPRLNEHYELVRPPQPVRLRHTVQDEAALQARGNFMGNLLGLFESLVAGRDLETALEVAAELCDLAPDDPAPWNVRARALDLSGHRSEAEALLEERLALATPGSTLAVGLRNALAAHALRNGDVDRCQSVSSGVVEDDPANVPARQALAECALRRQSYDEVQRHALSILETEPRHVHGLRLLAEGLFGAGQVAAACDALENAVAIAPGFQMLRARLAQFSQALGEA